MKTKRKKVISPMTLIFALTVCAFSLPSVAAADESVHEALAQIMSYQVEGKLEDGIQLANNILSRDDITARERVAVLSGLSRLTYAQGDRYYGKAREYLKEIADLGPCLIDLPEKYWAEELRRFWYQELMKRQESLTCFASSENPDELTVAIMEFDNYSSAEFQEELGYFAKGLAEIFMASFAQIPDMKVVERNKVNFLLNEYDLRERGLTTAVQVGNMLGAKVMVFGSIVQLDKKHGSMVIKAVNVETSQILATVEMQGTPKEYYEKQGELAKQLAEKLDKNVDEAALKQIDHVCTKSPEAAELYAEGLEQMDNFHYDKAYQFFMEASEKDPGFEEARDKMETYQLYATRRS